MLAGVVEGLAEGGGAGGERGERDSRGVTAPIQKRPGPPLWGWEGWGEAGWHAMRGLCRGSTPPGGGGLHDVAKAVYEEQSFENQMLKSYIQDSPG